MQKADGKTVLGDFTAGHFSYAGITSSFSVREGKFQVSTDGPDGKLHDYPVPYTFGVHPLQQYLIPFPGGRMQALSIAWDVDRTRWFHLYPEERIAHGDELHWTGAAMNWNHMCADCHSTGLRKNYQEAADRFDTRWSEISVGCEACHGPGSTHSADPSKRLAAPLDERRDITWTRAAGSATATRSKPRTTDHEIEVCAQCHARRGQIADGYRAGDEFLDYYRPALLTTPLYHADGQQREEVYEWGSFLQSRMYAAGVTCSDCHEPHGGKLRAQGNAVCTRCHAAQKFDLPAHHHHAAGSAGAQCVNCHMPTTTYMVIDTRRDHSIRLPRPDESVALGTPNACNACHAQRDAKWAAAQVKAWYGHEPQGYQHFAAAFAAAHAGAIGATARLRGVAGDATQPAIVRATALSELDVNLNAATLAGVRAGLKDSSPLVRLGALGTLTDAPVDLRVREVAPLLSDPMRAIRIEAANLLADAGAGAGTGSGLPAAFARATAEYLAAQRFNGDRADARTNLGSFEARRGDVPAGERELRRAIAVDPHFVPAYANLADLYRSLGREAEAQRILREGLERSPRAAVLHYALGLALVREKRSDEALKELAQGAKLEPANARFAYVYAVALDSFGHGEEALATLARARAAHPADTEILEALADLERKRGDEKKAQQYAEELHKVVAEQ